MTTEEELLNRGLPKWPQMLVTGPRLPEELALKVMEAFRVANHCAASAELRAALELVEQVANRHNFDDSGRVESRGRPLRQRGHRRIGYALRVTADSVIRRAENGVREEANPAIGALRQRAREAAERLGKPATKSICGRLGVEGCAQEALEKLLTLDATAAGRPVEYSPIARQWLAVDTLPCADCGRRVNLSQVPQSAQSACRCASCQLAATRPRSKSALQLEADINAVLRRRRSR